MCLSCPGGFGAARCKAAGAGAPVWVALRVLSVLCLFPLFLPSPPPTACRCSPLGSASPQCHENSTCVCRPGFVGYKCDRCQDNFFLTADRARCQECPSCYSLVKAEVSPPRPGPPTSWASQPAPAPGWALGAACSSSHHQLPPPCAHPTPWPMPTWASPHFCPPPAPPWTAALDPFSCRPPRSQTFSSSTGMRPQVALGGTGQEGDAHGHRRISSRAAVWGGGRKPELGAPPSPISCPVPSSWRSCSSVSLLQTGASSGLRLPPPSRETREASSGKRVP